METRRLGSILASEQGTVNRTQGHTRQICKEKRNTFSKSDTKWTH